MALLLFAVALFLSILIVPLGLPGLWLMLGAALIYDWLVPSASIGWLSLGIAVALTVLAEVLEWTLAANYTRKYGGSRRAGWGAIVGGIVGAVMGVPVPIIGSVIGAFADAFVGALVLEYSRREATTGTAARVATGALFGRVAAAATKTALGLAVATVLLFAAWL